MGTITTIFNLILYQPFFNALIFLYHYLPGLDLGWAIILLTIIIKFILFAPSYASIKSSASLQAMQPKLDALKKKYKDNREELGRQMMQLYKEHKVNPLSSCLPLLIQLPIIFALYRVFLAGVKLDPDTGLLMSDQLQHLYGWLREIYSHTPINTTFLGFIDLSATKNYVLALLAAGAQFWQSRMLMAKKPPKVAGAKDENMAAGVNRSMTYFFPILIFYFGTVFPAGLTLYWFTSTLFQVGQQYYFLKKKEKTADENPEQPVDKSSGQNQIT
jgi:YidC/Oxa1 family membrane protein insertase